MHDIIVIGASAGGLSALTKLISLLPRNLAATLFVTMHLPPEGPSNLATILRRAGTLEAVVPRYHEPLQAGYIYVAPPNWHMVLDQQGVHLTAGPREDGARPAVDPLFRSAAEAFGQRVVGILLSGNLDDGVAGLAAIKARGGLAIVQDPAEANFEGMPRSAIENVQVDHILPVAQIAPLLVQLTTRLEAQREELALQGAPVMRQEHRAQPEPSLSPQWDLQFGCPDCSGVLLPQEGGVIHFRCEMGHTYSPQTLISEQSKGIENALWAAMRALHEKARLLRKLATNAEARGSERSAQRFNQEAHQLEEQANTLRHMTGLITSGGEKEE